MNSVINFFKDGGIFLYPLALIFVVGVSIAIERYLYLTRETVRVNAWPTRFLSGFDGRLAASPILRESLSEMSKPFCYRPRAENNRCKPQE